MIRPTTNGVGGDGEPPTVTTKLEQAGEIISNIKRIEILTVLAVRPLLVGELAGALHYDQPDITRNLQYLESRGLIRSTHAGHAHVQQLSDSVVSRIVRDQLHLEIKTARGSVVIQHELDPVMQRCLAALRNGTTSSENDP